MTPGKHHRQIRDALVSLAAAYGVRTETIATGHNLSPRRVREIVAQKPFSAARSILLIEGKTPDGAVKKEPWEG